MRIDGRTVAQNILTALSQRVLELKKKNITPTLAVIQVGDDPGSTAYIKQKKKAAETIGAIVEHEKLPADTSYQHVNTLIHTYNADSTIHGFIVQQPLPRELGDTSQLLNQIAPQKDVDGFVRESPFKVPVAMAVMEILKQIQLTGSRPVNNSFYQWLQTQHVVVIGRGETAGKPIAEALINQGCNITVVHSHTREPDDVIQSADIVISCVGKPRVVTKNNLKPGAMLIGVGLWRDSEGKLQGDYNEEEIADAAGAFTPTPGGVGPVNVACLMQNLVTAVQKNH